MYQSICVSGAEKNPSNDTKAGIIYLLHTVHLVLRIIMNISF